MAPDQRNNGKDVVDDLLARVSTPEERDRELVHLIVERTAKSDPTLAEAIRVCAVPRRFDAQIFGAVWPDDGSQRRLLDAVVRYSFVRANPDGTFAYDETTRGVLLDEWRQPKRTEAFDDVNRRLVEFYSAQHDSAKVDEADLRRISDVVRRASPRRYVQVLSRIEESLTAPLLEALYHQSLRSPDLAYGLFQSLCFEYERQGRLSVYQILLYALRRDLEAADGDAGRKYLRWLRYWEGRIASGLQRAAEAEAISRELLKDTGGDEKLELWALAQLCGAQRDQEKYRAAMETALRQLARAEETRADPYNLSRSYGVLGDLHGDLEEPDEAENAYRRALQLARANNDTTYEALILLSLAAVLGAVGRKDEGISMLLEAFHVTRLRLTDNASSQLNLASRLAFLFVHYDPAIADTAFHEAEELMHEVEDPLQGLGLRTDWIQALRNAGQLDRADEQFAAHTKSVPGHVDERFRSGLLLTEALIAEAHGDLHHTVELYGGLLDRVKAGLGEYWHEVAALTNRGLQLVELGRWGEAEADLRAAERKWRENRHDVLADVMLANLADVARRKGDLRTATELLERARPRLQHSRLGRGAHYHRTRGAVLESEGKWPAAAEEYARALAIHQSATKRSPAAYVLAELARLNNGQSRWREAADQSSAAARFWQELAELNAYRPSEDVQTADRQNARAIRMYIHGASDRDMLASARDLFSAAADRAPGNALVHLNLAYADIRLGQWEDAAAQFDAAVELQPKLLSGSALADRAISCLTTVADEMFVAGDTDNAVAALRRVEERLRASGQDERLVGILLRIGDAYLHAGRRDAAVKAYEEARSAADRVGVLTGAATAVARLGVVRAVDGAANDAVGFFRRSLALRREAGSSAPYWDLLGDCSETRDPYVRDPILNRLLRELRDEPETGAEMTEFKPRLAATLPANWYAKESMTLLAPNGRANVIAASEPLEPSMTTEAFAEAQGTQLRKELLGYQEQDFSATDLLAGKRGLVRQFAWTPADGEPITQIQLYYAQNGRGYTATATAPTAEFGRLELQLRQVLEGLILQEPAARPDPMTAD